MNQAVRNVRVWPTNFSAPDVRVGVRSASVEGLVQPEFEAFIGISSTMRVGPRETQRGLPEPSINNMLASIRAETVVPGPGGMANEEGRRERKYAKRERE